MGLDVILSTDGDKFLALNTTEEDNDFFYGTGFGRGYARFTGPFAQTEAYINAATEEATNIVIPVSSDQEVSEINFINLLNEPANLKLVRKELDGPRSAWFLPVPVSSSFRNIFSLSPTPVSFSL